jgi:predicted RNA-binding protein with PUA-like domain
MAHWLLKTEPSTYSWDDLVRDTQTTWDGVTNATALIHIRAMKKGDPVMIYHTGDERAAIGVATVMRNPYPDPKANDPRIVIVDIQAKSKLPRPVRLDQIKADPAFAGFGLLRIGRLSVVPVPQKMWERIQQLSTSAEDASKAAPPKARKSKRAAAAARR